MGTQINTDMEAEAWGMGQAAMCRHSIHGWASLGHTHLPHCPLCAERAGQLVKSATDAGALGFLRLGVLHSVPMQARLWEAFASDVAVAVAEARLGWAGSASMPSYDAVASYTAGLDGVAYTPSTHQTRLMYPPPTRTVPTSVLQDEPDHQRQLYASILNQLLMSFLMCTAGK